MHTKISQQFEELGFDAPKDDILDKCVELCYEYKIDATEFVDQWIAFSVSNLNGSDPTIPYLLDMERKILITNKDKDKLSSNTSNVSKNNRTPIPSTSKQCRSYNNFQDLTISSIKNEEIIDEIDEVMDTYCKTPKTSKSHIARTPAREKESLFSSPVIYSPISGTTPRSHGKILERGKIICTIGNSDLIRETVGGVNENGGTNNGSDGVWSSTKHENIILKQILTYNNEPFTAKCKFMLDTLQDKALILYDKLFDIGKEICIKAFGKNDNTSYDLQNVNTISEVEPIKTIGRICYDLDEGKLTRTTTILFGLSVNDEEEQHQDCDQNQIVKLNLNALKSYGIFPGQTVMVTGTNPLSNTIYVDSIFTKRDLKISPYGINTELRLVIAAGPYTYHDDLLYEPLNNLISYCKNNQPDVLILLGPFMDTEHSMIKEHVLTESFESFFEKILAGIAEQIGSETKICVVSSYKDATSNCVYPTHPLTTRKNYPNVHMLPDPCIIDINGLTIGATSTDIFKHLVEEELSMNSGDKVKRIVNYLLHQGSFYPLNPPSLEVSFDSGLASKYAKLNIVPNLLILPSDQRYFMRNVEKCLAINPGRVVDISNGTFARLIARPSAMDDTNISSCTFGQIMII